MEKRENAKSSIIHRIRKPLKVTIDPENHEYLKEIGVNASRLLDKAVFELRKMTLHELVLISEKNEVNGLVVIRTRDLRRVKATS